MQLMLDALYSIYTILLKCEIINTTRVGTFNHHKIISIPVNKPCRIMVSVINPLWTRYITTKSKLNPEYSARCFAEDIVQCIIVTEIYEISLIFVCRCLAYNKPLAYQVGNGVVSSNSKLLSDKVLTQICRYMASIAMSKETPYTPTYIFD